MEKLKSISRGKILEMYTSFTAHVTKNKVGYLIYLGYSLLLGYIFPAAGYAAVLRKFCIPFLIGFKNTNYIFWPVLIFGIVCNVIVDSTTVIFLLSTVGLHWTVSIVPVTILSLMYVWTVDRVFVHKFRLFRIERICIILVIKKYNAIRLWLVPYLDYCKELMFEIHYWLIVHLELFEERIFYPLRYALLTRFW